MRLLPFVLMTILQAIYQPAAFARAGDELYQQAINDINQQQWQEASWLLEEVLQLNPNHQGAKVDLMLAYCQLEDFTRAGDLQRQLRALPVLPHAISDLIRQKMEQGCTEKTQWQGQLQSWVARDSNLDQGSSKRWLEVTLPDGVFNLEVDQSSLPRSGWLAGVEVQAMATPPGGQQWALHAGAVQSWPQSGQSMRWFGGFWQPQVRSNWGVGLQQFWLGSKSYQSSMLLEYRGLPSIARIESLLRLRAQFVDIAPRYQSLHSEWRGQYISQWRDLWLDNRAQLGFEFSPQRPGGNQYSAELSSKIIYPRGSHSLELQLRARIAQDQQGYSPLLEYNQLRQSVQTHASFAYQWNSQRLGRWRLEYLYQEQSDRLPLFSWQKKLISLSYKQDF
ncbi:tetratricopeptide repeat protein [Iodobacter ciconiae]|uniref:Tetratricopeptide repeat protein n=1 Tax=Iodobacter ciconiae TaxID=2496266 RepID=A0A3S8ZWJ6_9NEIS|nr:tetratricopeptide repeat protein [Iodobacter ciconiae]AZN37877.1 hypothetical protein EJO50_16230 [Iodobacter ciconiae]